MENDTSDDYCKKIGTDVVTHPYYRAMQILHILLSTSSIILILCVLKKYRRKFVFHYNIWVLFMSLLFGSLLHASLVAFFQSYQLFLSFTFVEQCDVILPRYFYASIHIPFIYSILWIEATQIVMLIERAIAIFYVGQYETCTKKFGNSLFCISIVIPFAESLWAYADESFENTEISCINTPVSRTSQINALFIFSITFHLITLIAMAVIFYSHRRKSGSSQTLSSRFQFSENVTSSRLLIVLSGIQLVVFFSYGCATMYLRMTFNATRDSLPIYKSNILTAYLVPVYTFLLPSITMIFLYNVKQSRRSEIRTMIEIKSSGAEGWANYSDQLQQQWNT